MAKLPEKIYLQVNVENIELDGATWCQDRINKTDIEYISIENALTKFYLFLREKQEFLTPSILTDYEKFIKELKS